MTSANEKPAVEEAPPSGVLQAILVAAFLAVSFAFSFYLGTLRDRPQPRPQAGEQEIVVETQIVRAQDAPVRFRATGSVRVNSMTALVPQVSGEIVSVQPNFFSGGSFRANEVLFQIERDDFQDQVENLRAEVEQARTQLEIQKARSAAAVEEWEGLNPGDPLPELVGQKPQLREAEATLRAAKARLAQAARNLARTSFTLPYDGRITQADLTEGQFVTAGQSVGQAYGLSALEVDVPLKYQEYLWLLEKPDPEVMIHYSDREPLKARVKRIGAEFDPMTRFGRVFLTLEDPPGSVIPGLFVTAEFKGPMRKNVWALPASALQEDNGIWVVGPEQTLKRLRPEIIHIDRDQVMTIARQEEAEVVLGPLPDATDGTKVRRRRGN